MTSLRKISSYPLKPVVTPAQDPRIHSLASKVGRFFGHLMEMLLAIDTGTDVAIRMPR